VIFHPLGPVVWGLGDYDDPELQFGGTDSDGTTWSIRVEGWNRTSVATPVIEGGGDGGWFAPGRRRPKVMTLTGAFRACSELYLDVAEQRLRAALERFATDQTLWRSAPYAPGTEVRLGKQMAVRLTGDLDVDPVRLNPKVRTFSAVVTAADPLKYAAGADGLITYPFALPQNADADGVTFPLTFPLDFGGVEPGGRHTVINWGTVPVLPRVVYTGPVDTPRLQHLGIPAAEGVNYALLPGEELVVDHATGLVSSGTRSLFSQKIAGNEFWPLLPGSNDVVFTANAYNADARAALTFRPAWS